ncbi:hypothetical protein Q1695_009945 [Nippostrongylus brasiliensis]|nr:hypothetical protein Q1695_009945 [Nippostrongylus brasiliensis]
MSNGYYSSLLTTFEEEEHMPNLDPVLKSLRSKANGSVTAGFPYDSKFVKALLKDVHVMIIGDSLMRGIYKDLIVLLHGNDLIDDAQLRAKTESSFFGDRQIDILPLENDRVFRQAREFQTDVHLIQYLFTTRVMKTDVDIALLELCSANEFPDVIFINSCLWDITRYSRAFDLDVPPNVQKQAGVERLALEEFLERVSMLLRRLRLILPATTQVVWINMPWPLTVDGRSILNRADNAETRHLNRMMIVDANFRVSQLFRAAGYDVLDIGFYMRNQSLYSYRVKDGVHWDCVGTRIMTQLVVGHLARSWNIPLPNRIKDKLAKYAEEACTLDPKKNWAAFTLMGFDMSTRSGKNSREEVSFPESIQQKIRAGLLQEIKEQNKELYDSLRRDIKIMRISKLFEENPTMEMRMKMEDIWELDEMTKSFPNHAKFLNKVKPQEVTVLINEDVSSRKRKHSPDRC